MEETVDYDQAVERARESTGQVTLASGFYPRKDLRGRRPRSRSKQQAMYRAVYYAVEQARISGLIVRTGEGYEMRW